MKKITALILAILMAVSLLACNNDTSVDKGTDGAQQEAKLTRGTIAGNVYTTDYLGFSFEKPETWVYSTDEEIAATLNFSIETFLDNSFKEALEKSGTIYDMMVTDTLTSTNIIVGYESLPLSNITEDQYFEAMKQQLQNVTGYTVDFPDEYEKITLGKNEFTKAVCVTTVYDSTITQVYYVRKVDQCMAFVIATIPAGYAVSDIEAMFS
ncbi:MAG: hypothetical protein IKL81_02520 [Clostridia bacterium]|nr:hypothetical protein [Clostridia bacterium]